MFLGVNQYTETPDSDHHLLPETSYGLCLAQKTES